MNEGPIIQRTSILAIAALSAEACQEDEDGEFLSAR